VGIQLQPVLVFSSKYRLRYRISTSTTEQGSILFTTIPNEGSASPDIQTDLAAAAAVSAFREIMNTDVPDGAAAAVIMDENSEIIVTSRREVGTSNKWAIRGDVPFSLVSHPSLRIEAAAGAVAAESILVDIEFAHTINR